MRGRFQGPLMDVNSARARNITRNEFTTIETEDGSGNGNDDSQTRTCSGIIKEMHGECRKTYIERKREIYN